MLRRIYSTKSIEKLLGNITDITKGIMLAGGVGIFTSNESITKTDAIICIMGGVGLLFVISVLDTIYINPKEQECNNV